MQRVSDQIRRRIAELGLLSRPLGEARARELALALAGTLSREIAANGDPERVLKIYEARLIGDVETAIGKDNTINLYGRAAQRPLKDVLQRFSSADLAARA